MTLFVLLSWLVCTTVTIWLVMNVLMYRYMLVKPAFLVTLFLHLQIQWTATVNASFVEETLRNPWEYFFAVHFVLLICAFGSTMFGRNYASIVWSRITDQSVIFFGDSAKNRLIFALFAYIIVFTAYYLSVVPLSQTGLYATFYDRTNASLAREASLKLIQNPIILYGFSVMSRAVAPFLASLLTERIVGDTTIRKVRKFILLATILPIVLICVTLPGARFDAALVLFAVSLTYLLKKGFPSNPLYIMLLILIVLLIPAILTLQKETGDITFSGIWDSLSTSMVRRVFWIPWITGVWHAEYAQNFGFFGVSGVGRLAVLLNEPVINVPHLIGVTYLGGTTTFGNTSFLLSYYSYFRLVSVPLNIVLILILDIVLIVYLKVHKVFLVATVAACATACLSFTSSDYTTVLLSHGFGTSLALAWAASFVFRIKFKDGNYTTAMSLYNNSKLVNSVRKHNKGEWA